MVRYATLTHPTESGNIGLSEGKEGVGRWQCRFSANLLDPSAPRILEPSLKQRLQKPLRIEHLKIFILTHADVSQWNGKLL
jgi:hypothetical protein